MAVISTENAKRYRWGGKCSGWHLLEHTSLSVVEELVPSGCSEIRHYHSRSEQFFYVLFGTLTIELDGVEYELQRNTGLHVSAGFPHTVKNVSDLTARFLVISSPPTHGDRAMA